MPELTSSSTVAPVGWLRAALESATYLDEQRPHRIPTFSLKTWSECCGLSGKCMC